MKHTKSKERVQELGEVFTPPKTVKQMIDMLDIPDWSKEGLTFFEPTCGNGQFVVDLISRRLSALYERYLAENKECPEARSAVEAIHSIWAIDIDAENIVDCRLRVYTILKDFLREKTKSDAIADMYMVTIVMIIADRIFQNDCLTALSPNEELAKIMSGKTKASQKWFEAEGYVPMPFTFKRN